eukprot:2695709-Ditylum_brightwellii.AAC.1
MTATARINIVGIAMAIANQDGDAKPVGKEMGIRHERLLQTGEQPLGKRGAQHSAGHDSHIK